MSCAARRCDPECRRRQAIEWGAIDGILVDAVFINHGDMLLPFEWPAARPSGLLPLRHPRKRLLSLEREGTARQVRGGRHGGESARESPAGAGGFPAAPRPGAKQEQSRALTFEPEGGPFGTRMKVASFEPLLTDGSWPWPATAPLPCGGPVFRPAYSIGFDRQLPGSSSASAVSLPWRHISSARPPRVGKFHPGPEGAPLGPEGAILGPEGAPSGPKMAPSGPKGAPSGPG